MKLTGKVVRIESGEQFVNKQQRILIKVNDSWSGKLEVSNDDGLALDDELEIFVFRKIREAEVLTGEQRQVIE